LASFAKLTHVLPHEVKPDVQAQLPLLLHAMLLPHDVPVMSCGLLQVWLVELVEEGPQVPALWHRSPGQVTAVPLPHEPVELQVSPVVQPLASSHEAPVFTGFEQVPVVGSQVPTE
jgi:hypothetical protein